MIFDKKAIIEYRLERSDEALEEAKILAQIQHWNVVANRLYYACFYAVIGLLLNNDFRTKSHDGARTILNKEFVKTGHLSKNLGWLYGDLFNKRQESDYKDIKRFTKEDIEPLIAQAEEFIKIIRGLIH